MNSNCPNCCDESHKCCQTVESTRFQLISESRWLLSGCWHVYTISISYTGAGPSVVFFFFFRSRKCEKEGCPWETRKPHNFHRRRWPALCCISFIFYLNLLGLPAHQLLLEGIGCSDWLCRVDICNLPNYFVFFHCVLLCFAIF